MPVLDFPIKSINSTIINPVSEQVTNRILKWMNIYKYFNNNIYFKSDIQVADNFKTELPHKQGKLSTTNRVDVEIIPEFNPKSTKFEMLLPKFIHNSNTHRNGWKAPIFYDLDNNISLTEYGTPMSIQLNFKMRLQDTDLASEVAYNIYNLIGPSGKAMYQEFKFEYPIPELIIVILYELYKLAKYKDENNELISFQTYLSAGSDRAIDIMVNRNKLNNKQLVISRAVNYSMGVFEFPGNKPEPNKINKLTTTSFIEFNYTFQFLIPSYLRLDYPIVINNKYLDDKYIKLSESINKMQDFNNTETTIPEVRFGDYIVRLNTFNKKLLSEPPTIIYPQEDDWNIPLTTDVNLSTYTTVIFRGILSPLVDVDQGKYYVELNLNEDLYPILDNNQLTELKECLQYFITEENWSDILRFRCPICCGIFSNDNKINSDEFTLINDDGNIKLRYISDQVKPDNIYRIVIGVNERYVKYSNIYVLDLFKFPSVFGKIIYNNYRRMAGDGFIELVDMTVYEKYKLGLARPDRNDGLFGIAGLPIRIHNYLIKLRR